MTRLVVSSNQDVVDAASNALLEVVFDLTLFGDLELANKLLDIHGMLFVEVDQ